MSAPARPVTAVLVGASGRMGRALLAAGAARPELRWVGAIASPTSGALGSEVAPGLRISADLAAVLPAQVVIDFSHPSATRTTLRDCRAARSPLLLGTTGQGASLEADFAAAAREIPLLIAPNTSLGVTVLLELAALAAGALPAHHAAIREVHHRGKRDAPSGTALALAAAVRQGHHAASIPIQSEREGEVIGEHRLSLEGEGEILAFTHRALDRGLFARGALAAALWLASRPPGRYAMRDMLFGKTKT